jgi:hypothetical protein
LNQVKLGKISKPGTSILLCESGLAKLEGYVGMRMKKKGIMLNMLLIRKFRRGLIFAYFFILGVDIFGII